MLSKRILLYYLSAEVTDLSPPLESMKTVEADSPAEGAERLCREGTIPPGSALGWAHFVAAVDDDDVPRGFNSVSLSTVNHSPETATERFNFSARNLGTS